MVPGVSSACVSVEGELRAEGLRFAVLVSRFNSFITERLLDGATDAIVRCGGKAADIEVVRIPGAWEFPLALKAVPSSASAR
jgi:6,7-dimethyl-8-ribityllumazine synthase